MKRYYSSERNVDTIAEIDLTEFGPIRHPNRYAPDYIFGMQYPLIRQHVEAIERDMTAAMTAPQDGRKKTQRAIEIDHDLWTPDQPARPATPGQLADRQENAVALEKLENYNHDRRIKRLACHVAAIPKVTTPTGEIDFAHGLNWDDLNR